MNKQSDFQQSPHPVYFEEEVHLRDYFKVLRRRLKALLVIFAVVFFAAALYTFGMRPVYQAETLLQVTEESRGPTILGDLAELTRGAGAAETQIEVLKSRSLLSEVVRALGLDVSLSGISRNPLSRFPGLLGSGRESVFDLPSVVRLDVPQQFLGERLFLVFDGSGREYTLFQEKKGFLKGRVNQLEAARGFAIEVRWENPRPGAKFIIVKHDLREATGNLLGNLRVSQVGRNTGVVRAAYQSTDPKKAAAVLETLNRLYINRDVEERSREAIAILDFITGQLGQVRRDLERAQDELDEYKVRTGAVALSQEAELLVQRISDLEVETSRLDIQRKGLESLLEGIGRGEVSFAAGTAALDIQSPELGILVQDYAELMKNRSQLLLDFTEENPAVVDLDRQIELVSGQIKATAGAILSGTARRLEAVSGVLQTYRRQLAKLPEVERVLAKFQKDVLIQEKIYSFLVEKEQETRIVKASSISGIRVVDPPTVPLEPVKPKTRRNLLLGLILGLMLGVGGAFFTEYLDDTIKEDDEPEAMVGVPVYGRFPFLKEARDRRREKRPHLVIEQPRSPATEAFRILRTNILFSRVGESPKVITITSSGPGEGKSFVVANLAAVSSLSAKKTIVIDADLRKPQQHIVFGADQRPGLAEVLTGKAVLADTIQNLSQGLPSFLSAGSIPPNPSELLGSPYMKQLLELLKKEYELIVLDSPPLGLFTDPALLMKHADMGLIIVRAGMTRRDSIGLAVDTVRRTSRELQLGIVINAVKYRGGEYGYRNGYARYGE